MSEVKCGASANPSCCKKLLRFWHRKNTLGSGRGWSRANSAHPFSGATLPPEGEQERFRSQREDCEKPHKGQLPFRDDPVSRSTRQKAMADAVRSRPRSALNVAVHSPGCRPVPPCSVVLTRLAVRRNHAGRSTSRWRRPSPAPRPGTASPVIGAPRSARDCNLNGVTPEPRSTGECRVLIVS